MPQLTGPQLKAAIWLAAIVLVVYLGGVVWLSFQRGGTDTDWTRAIFVLNAVQALAFSAAGWVWGTQVNGGVADLAQKQTQDAQQETKNIKADLDQAKKETASETKLRMDAEADTAARKERSRAGLLAIDTFLGNASPHQTADPDGGTVASATESAGPPSGPNDVERMKSYLRQLDPELFENQ